MNIKPKRQSPSPIPAVHPIWEYQADGTLKDVYEDYKRAFQVPWVGVVSMAYAHYQNFFGTWWRGMHDLVGSKAYVETAQKLRTEIEAKIDAFAPEPIAGRLESLGYSARELDDIRNMIEFFSHGNFIQIPAVFAARLLLEGGRLDGGGETPVFEGRHGSESATPFILMEPHHGLDDIKDIYQDIKTTLNLPFVNTDYRALARWPSYFELAWGDLRTHIGTQPYDAMTQAMHDAIFDAVAALPNPAGLEAQALQQAANKDGSLQEVLEVTKLFTYLLPGLIANVAYFRAQLEM